MSESFWVIVPAAGHGVRAGFSLPKQFRSVAGVTVLERTVRKISSLPGIQGIVIPLPPGMSGGGGTESGLHPSGSWEPGDEVLSEIKGRLAAIGGEKVRVLTVEGGATRQASVREALRVIPEDVEVIAIHDACRPFFSESLFMKVVRAAFQSGAAICGVRPRDTVKMVEANASCGGNPCTVASTLDRDSLVDAQTPQAFAADILRKAYDLAERGGVSATDDAQLVELLGHPVQVIQGETFNLKLTYPEDFLLAEVLSEGAEDGSSICSGGSDTVKPKQGASLGESREDDRRWRDWRDAQPREAIGLGFDIHRLEPGRRCVIGGVEIPFEKGLAGHSDADVLCHAIMDAILGALGDGDIGKWFPTDDPKCENASSIELMASMWQALKDKAEIINVDAVVIAEVPRIMPHAGDIRRNIGKVLGIPPERVSVKATTAEGLGALGRKDGIAAFATALVMKR